MKTYSMLLRGLRAFDFHSLWVLKAIHTQLKWFYSTGDQYRGKTAKQTGRRAKLLHVMRHETTTEGKGLRITKYLKTVWRTHRALPRYSIAAGMHILYAHPPQVARLFRSACYNKIDRYFGGVLNKTIITLAFVGYEIIIVNSYPTPVRRIIVKYRL